MSYTKGPWKVRDKKKGGKNYVVNTAVMGGDDRHWIVGEVYGHDFNGSQLANARLIAAAPELLEAAKRVLHGLEHMTTEEFQRGTDKDLRDILIRAIAKAEGE